MHPRIKKKKKKKSLWQRQCVLRRYTTVFWFHMIGLLITVMNHEAVCRTVESGVNKRR